MMVHRLCGCWYFLQSAARAKEDNRLEGMRVDCKITRYSDVIREAWTTHYSELYIFLIVMPSGKLHTDNTVQAHIEECVPDMECSSLENEDNIDM